jgi:3-hydroxyacyl-[acyl-carrier-protein] dehydratase
MPPAVLFDYTTLDFDRVVADQEAIRRVNMHRFEIEQLTAVVHIDPAQHLLVGYKDVGPNEFWVRGHMPGYPLMPGVIICEAAAQLSSYYCLSQKIVTSDFIAFSGMENVRFRHPVRVGDRLILVTQMTKANRRQIVSINQAFVGTTMAFHGEILGVPYWSGSERSA